MLAVLDTARNRRMPGARREIHRLGRAVAALLPLAVVAATTIPTMVEIDDCTCRRPRRRPHRRHRHGPRPLQQSPVSAQSQGAGTWAVQSVEDARDGASRDARGRSSSGSTVPVSQLEGLTSAQMSGDGGPVRFPCGATPARSPSRARSEAASAGAPIPSPPIRHSPRSSRSAASAGRRRRSSTSWPSTTWAWRSSTN